MSGQVDRLHVLGRWECAEHGGELGRNRDAGPLAWCSAHHDWVNAVWVEYVPSSQLAGAVDRIERAAALLARVGVGDKPMAARDGEDVQAAYRILTGGQS